jgi:hypothetical protein
MGSDVIVGMSCDGPPPDSTLFSVPEHEKGLSGPCLAVPADFVWSPLAQRVWSLVAVRLLR